MTLADKNSIASYVLFGLGLVGVLMLHLVPALFSGFLVYLIVEFGSRALRRGGVVISTGKILLLALVAGIIISSLSLLMLGISSQVMSGPEGLGVLLQRIADVVGKAGSYLPPWIVDYFPANINEWQVAASTWLMNNATDFSKVGIGLGIFLAHIIIGMIIGGMVALHPHRSAGQIGLARMLQERLGALTLAFQRIAFSQIRISALNTFLTAIFILGVLPLMDMQLPLKKTMIAVTFIAGLLPVIGNLISNSVIFLVGLSVAPLAGVVALAYLIIIHKLEYFLNARIIGTQIHARAWELLIAMLVMEAAFGIAGVVAAPIYYAYLKDELSAKKLI